MPHQKITQALVDSLPYQNSGPFWVHDTELSGFNLSVGKQTKTYYAAGEHAGRFIRVKIGRSDVTKANEALAVARDVLLPEIRRGVDPRAKQLSDDDQTYARILAGVREARPEDLTDQMARRIMRGKSAHLAKADRSAFLEVRQGALPRQRLQRAFGCPVGFGRDLAHGVRNNQR